MKAAREEPGSSPKARAGVVAIRVSGGGDSGLEEGPGLGGRPGGHLSPSDDALAGSPILPSPLPLPGPVLVMQRLVELPAKHGTEAAL